MSERSPHLDMPYLMPSQAQKHVTHNEALQQLDAVVQLSVKAFEATTPPGAPEEGMRYALGENATGAWAGQDGKLAQWTAPAWQFFDPQEGWRAWGETEQVLKVYWGSTWQTPPMDMLGLNTTADDTNRLAVASPSTLLTHEGAGHQLKINKSSDTDTASMMFQSRWTGHAEMGLAGDNNWHLKTSPDGGNWTEALQIEAATGLASGAAVQASETDDTDGRLLRINGSYGAFGLGGRGIRETSDLNAITNSGFYTYDASTANIPTSNGTILHISRTSSIHTQIAISRASSSKGAVYTRATDGATWSDWRQVHDDQHSLVPAQDANQNIGSAALRYDNIYAANAAIQTSDARLKQDMSPLSAAERRVAHSVRNLLCRYRFCDAVSAKGDAARLHFGLSAQDVAAAFEAEGLDPWRYALLCKDVWWEIRNPHSGRYDIHSEDPGHGIRKSRLGVRYNEVMAFLMAAQA